MNSLLSGIRGNFTQVFKEQYGSFFSYSGVLLSLIDFALDFPIKKTCYDFANHLAYVYWKLIDRFSKRSFYFIYDICSYRCLLEFEELSRKIIELGRI